MVSLPIKLRQPSREFQFLTTHKSKRYLNEIHQTILQLTAMMSKTAHESIAAVQRLSDEIEPPALAQDPNFATASRAELDSYRRDLKTAEVNASSAMLRYAALLKEEREKIKNFATSLQIRERTVRDALEGVDKRHARVTSISSKMMLARSEFYRAYGDSLSILIEQHGAFKIGKSGQFIFSSNPIAERYNVATNAMNAAAKRVANLEDEGKKLMQMQQTGFDRFISGQ